MRGLEEGEVKLQMRLLYQDRSSGSVLCEVRAVRQGTGRDESLWDGTILREVSVSPLTEDQTNLGEARRDTVRQPPGL